MKFVFCVIASALVGMFVLLRLGVHYQDQARRDFFQTEFGIAYPSTPDQKDAASLIIMMQMANLYQKSIDSWARYSTLKEQLEATEDAKTKIALSRQVERAEVEQRKDYESLKKGCLKLYAYHAGPTGTYSTWRTENYPEVQIPPIAGCSYPVDDENWPVANN